MAFSNISGFPRIGARRELKFAVEGYWREEVSRDQLTESARTIRTANRDFIRQAGIDLIPSNDFSLYDHVLDTIALVGAVPPRYGHPGGKVDLDTYFAMARGLQRGDVDVTAMEMVKWFNTNYHYIVPELSPEMEFALSGDKPFTEHEEDMEEAVNSVPVLLGPLSFLLLAKPGPGVADFDRLSLLPKLVAVYQAMFGEFAKQGTEWIQFDEPVLAEDRSEAELEALRTIYRRLAGQPRRPKIVIKTYFDHVGESYKALAALPVEGVGLDFVYGPQNLEFLRAGGKLKEKTLFAGIVDGRNVWVNDLDRSLELLTELGGYAEQLAVSTSCSLLHVPIDADDEPGLDEELRSWVAFAKQKVREVVTLTKGINEGSDTIAAELEANRAALERRRTSPRTVNPAVRGRLAAVTSADAARYGQYPHRRRLQHGRLGLPLLPTTTIGSFPQTAEIRHARAQFTKGELSKDGYREAMRGEIERVVRFQEEAGMDVLVHGEPERNDMVQYFAEQLDGFAFTKNAWVQSYGSRYVRPPIIFGDVRRRGPMTVEWFSYAQSLTNRPMKGMLTGPVTMLMWSFVRDDQPPSDTCRQLALAIRDEVADLEKAGARVIQVDEAALREGLPLRRDRWQVYLDWAVTCFRLATAGAADETQVQTHLCYSEFGDIIDAVDRMDADVTLIWCARAGMRLVDDLQSYGYAREVGPGVYDIHSPRIPTVEELAEEIRLATKRLEIEQIWINPDCGLKTRAWDEAGPSLRNMAEAARRVRRELSGGT